MNSGRSGQCTLTADAACKKLKDRISFVGNVTWVFVVGLFDPMRQLPALKTKQNQKTREEQGGGGCGLNVSNQM